jgi:hypothetical protein
MKYTFFLLFAIILFACHGSGSTNTVSTDTSSTGAMQDSSVTASNSGSKNAPAIHDTILWIGKSARWKKSLAEVYDGSYDSLTSFFIPCGKTSTIKVSRENIEFDLVSNCDTSFGSRVRIFDLIRGDSTPVILPHQIVLDNATLLNKSTAHFNNGTETIALKPAQLIRVQQAAASRKDLYTRKVMMTQKN